MMNFSKSFNSRFYFDQLGISNSKPKLKYIMHFTAFIFCVYNV